MVLMIQVHLMELFAQPAVLDSWAGRISLFLGGPPVAPVFLLVMGYYLAASQAEQRPPVVARIKLIGLGGLLNLGLNAHLLVKIGQGTIALDPRPYILGVDILFLAGASTMMLAVLRPVLRRPAVLAAVLAGLVALISPWVTDCVDDHCRCALDPGLRGRCVRVVVLSLVSVVGVPAPGVCVLWRALAHSAGGQRFRGDACMENRGFGRTDRLRRRRHGDGELCRGSMS